MSVTNIFHDTFTEAANTNLVNHTPDTGASWTQIEKSGGQVGRVQGAVGYARITGNETDDRWIGSADETPVTNEYDVRHTHEQDASDNAQFTFFTLARMTDASNYYLAQVRPGPQNPDREIWKTVAGTDTQITTANVGNDAAHKFEIRDATKRYYGGVDFDNLTQDMTTTDNAITAIGEGGLGWGNAVASNADMNTSWHIDEFWVDEVDVVAAAVPPPLIMVPHVRI